MKRITMADLAKRLGIARSTVSRALNNDPQISKAVRLKVQQTAEESGFQREAAFAVLARHRKITHDGKHCMTVAFLAGIDLHTDDYLEGTRSKAAELGYGVDCFRICEYTDTALQRVLLSRGIRGLMLPILNDQQPLPRLDWQKFTAVCCSVDAHHPPFHSVRVNVASKISLAWRYLAQLGCKRIAIALAHPDSGPTELDIQRIGTALFHLRKQPGEPLLYEKPFAASGDLLPWLAIHQPDAVILGNRCFVEPYDAYTEMKGLTIPHCCLLPSPGRLHLDSQAHIIGSTAMSLLHQQIIENQFGFPACPFTVLLDPVWSVG